MAIERREEEIRERLGQVEENIAVACARAGRDREEVTLIAISKTRSVEEIEAAYRCGLRDFGENRVDEALGKVPELNERHSEDPIRWHMVGHVQRRKAEDAIAFANIIHSLDSIRLARRLERFLSGDDRLPILLELNVSGESSKYGFEASDDDSLAAFIEEARQMPDFPHLDVQGLMTMAPLVEDLELARPTFQRLRQVRDRLREVLPYSDWSQLSMGMTNDYKVAVEEGATMLRVGRAIFGEREY